MPMSKTERLAFDWLVKNGVKKDNIIYNPSRSPDFVLSDGRRFEVKRLYKNKILIRKSQFEKLAKDKSKTAILVMNENLDKPVEIIPLGKIFLGQERYNNILMHWLDNVQSVMLRQETWKKLMLIKIEEGFSSLDDLMNHLINETGMLKRGGRKNK